MKEIIRATTIICVRKDDRVAIAGDGQVSFGETVIKSNAVKIRKLYNNQILCGFAGAAADAITLMDLFEKKIEEYRGDLKRASVELAKEWRTEKYLRQLEALIIVANKSNTYIIAGDGNIIEPEDNIAAIGSGGQYARAAAKALMKHNKEMSALDIVKEAMLIASEICIYTNNNISVMEL